MNMIIRISFRFIVMLSLSQTGYAEDWPQFLGNSDYGISQETGLIVPWPDRGPEKIWEQEIGTGYSAPSVLGNRLVIHHRLRNESIISCLNLKTAESIWEYRYDSQFRDPYGYNNGPRCSPLLTSDHCITLGAQGKLLCLDFISGKKRWEMDIKKAYNVPDGFFGVGATPILHGQKLIVLAGGQPNSGVIALDASSGKVLWESVGKATWNGVATGWKKPTEYEWSGEEMVVSYSSPIVRNIHGQDHLLCLMRHGLVSLNPEDGQERFKYWFRVKVHESVNAARPLVIGNSIFLSAAYYDQGSVLLQVAQDGRSVSERWKNPNNLQTHWSTAIHDQGVLYGFSGRHENEGTLRCLDLKTGNINWQTTGWERSTQGLKPLTNSSITDQSGAELPWPYYGRGSAILVDQHLIVLGERGTVALVKANPKEFIEVSRFKPKSLNYPSWAAPVLSNGLLLLRDEDSLVCYRVIPDQN